MARKAPKEQFDPRKRLTKKERREVARRLSSDDPGFEVIHPDTAGIDVGNEFHYVSVPPDRDAKPVRRFGCCTADLRALAAWLKECGIQHVAMQSTGVYWVGLYDVLDEQEFDLCLANARHTKNLPGRKSDVQESQWLRKLHTYGMLNNSFRPSGEIRELRAYWRHRNEQVESTTSCIQRMQKVLTEMNIQLANVISDISGLTGQRIIRAIVAGERDGSKLAALADVRIQATAEQIARSLEGNWRPELLFILRQQVELYDTYKHKIADCDVEIDRHMASLPERVMEATEEQEPAPAPAGKPRKRRKKTQNAPAFDLAAALKRVAGVDLTRIDGVDVMVAQTAISEAGIDMSRWKTERHFTSWLCLCPMNETSGGKVLRRGTRKAPSRLRTALRLGASTLLRSKSYLGAQYRQLRTRLGAPKAITAMARKLACLIYRMLKHGQEYVDQGMELYEQQYHEQQVHLLKKKAARLGYQVLALQPIAG